MQAIPFKNFSSESFTWNFDGIAYTFEAGQEIFLEDFKAYHFGKHLIDRELNKKGIPTDKLQARKEMEALCFPSAEAISPVEALDLEAKKKVGRPKKKVEEEEFADIEK